MNDHDELFDAYLHGRLPVDEREAFNERLHAEAAFALDFDLFRASAAIVEVAGEQRLKDKLRTIHAEMDRQERKGRVLPMFGRSWLAIAATLVMAVGAAYYFLGKSKDPQDLFAEHMVAYSGPDRLRSDSADADDPWVRFTDLYNTQRYDEALRELDVLPLAPVPDYLRAFYRGQCLMLRSSPDPKAAMAAFQQVLDVDNDLHAPAHWYIALSALKTDEVALARTHLEELVKADGYKHDESRELLDALPQEQPAEQHDQ